MASAIESSIQSLIEAFNELAKAGDIPKQTVTKVNKALNSISTGAGHENIDQISRSLTSLKRIMESVGDTKLTSNLQAVKDFANNLKQQITEIQNVRKEMDAATRSLSTKLAIDPSAITDVKEIENALKRLDTATNNYLKSWRELKATSGQAGPGQKNLAELADMASPRGGRPVALTKENASAVQQLLATAEKFLGTENLITQELKKQLELLREAGVVDERNAKKAEEEAAKAAKRTEQSRYYSRESLYGPGAAGQRGGGGGGQGRKPEYQFESVSSFNEALNNPRQIRAFSEAVSKLGLEGAKIKTVYTDAASGITSINLEAEQANGILRKATVRMNEHGQIVSDLSTRYQGFGRAVSNNVVKVLNWAVALGLVYGAMNKVRELVQETIDIQRELTEVQIATGQASSELNKVFAQSAVIAKQTGSSVKGVIEGYSEAYAAAGSIEDPAKRSAAAQVLLRDSMILAKLAGLEQAQALDILTGALRQSGRGLDEGLQLIDKFVAVSKEANVSINTLASTYAIVGTAAEDVGLSLDELNALAATLAESTKLSADETGNAIRGFVSGFQSASAEKALASFGIAVRNSNGELRDFVDLVEQIVQLNEQGVISDRNMAEIANIVGGGFRRGSQFATFLENFPRFNALRDISDLAEGDAISALDLQLNTLETAITQLGNSFSVLAQTLGDDGGLVELLTGLANGLSSALEFVSDLVDGLGRATPYLLAYGAALAFINSNQGEAFLGRIKTPKFLGGGKGGMYGTLGDLKYAMGDQGLQSALGYSKFQQGVLRASPGILGAGIVAGGALAEGDPGKAVASIVGGIVGGIATAGNPVAVVLGSTIASSFYESTINHDIDIIGRRIALGFEAARGKDLPDDEEGEKSLEDRFAESLTGGEKFSASVGTWLLNNIPKFIPDKYLEDIDFEFAKEDLYQRQLQAGTLNPESADLLRQINALSSVKAIEEGIQPTQTAEAIAAAAAELSPILEANIADYVQTQLEALGRGDISPTDFTGSKQLISRLGEQASIITVGLEIAGIDDLQPEQLIDLLLTLKEEERVFVTSIVGEIIDLQDKINALNEQQVDVPVGSEARGKIDKEISDLTVLLEESRNRLQESFPAIQESAQLREARELVIPIIDVSDISSEEVDAVIALGEKLQKEYYNSLGMSDETAKLIAENNQEQIIRLLSDTGQEFLGRTKVGKGFLDIAADVLGTPLGGAGAAKEDPFSLLDYRGKYSVGELPGLQGKYNAFRDQLTSIFPQLKPDEQDFGVIADDGFGTMHADMTILNLLMEELIDVNKDQLNGIYNLPTDGTFFVPFTGAYLDSQTRSMGSVVGTALSDTGDDVSSAVSTSVASLLDENDQFTEGSQLADLLAHEFEDQPPGMSTAEDMAVAKQEIMAYLQHFAESGGEDPYRRPQIAALEASQNTIDNIKEIVTRFQLNIDQTTTLTLDGRVIASVVKQFLYEDLIRTEGGATVVRDFVL